MYMCIYVYVCVYVRMYTHLVHLGFRFVNITLEKSAFMYCLVHFKHFSQCI